MTFQEFEAQLDRTLEQMRLLGNGKGIEYANNQQEDRLANFTRIAKAYNLEPTVVCAIYLEKHLDAIRSYVRTGREFSEEKIEGRIRDAQLYLSLLEALISDLKVTRKGIVEKAKLEDGCAVSVGGLVTDLEDRAIAAGELEPLDEGLKGCWWLKSDDKAVEKLDTQGYPERWLQGSKF